MQLDDFLTLESVYGGQKINGQTLYSFNPPHDFLMLCKIDKSSKIDMKMRPNTEGVKSIRLYGVMREKGGG